MPTLSSLVSPGVVVMTICGIPCDVKTVIMTTLGFQTNLLGFGSESARAGAQFNLIPFYQNFSISPNEVY